MALRFDSGTEWLSRTSGLINHNGAYTVMAWARASSFSANGVCWAALTSSSNSGGVYANADYVGFRSGGELQLGARKDGGGVYYAGGSYSPDTWYHIAVVRSSTTSLKAYLNGVLVLTNDSDISGRSATASEVLGEMNNDQPFNGRIAAFKAWGAVLTAGEIEDEMDVGPPVRSSDLIIYTPINAANLNDSLISVSGSNWTANGAPTVEDGPPIDWGGGGGGNALLLQLMQHGQFNGGLL